MNSAGSDGLNGASSESSSHPNFYPRRDLRASHPFANHEPNYSLLHAAHGAFHSGYRTFPQANGSSTPPPSFCGLENDPKFKFVLTALWYAIMAGGSYTGMIGTRDLSLEILSALGLEGAPAETTAWIISALTGIINFQIFRTASKNLQLDRVKKYWHVCLFFATCNAFASGLLTFKQLKGWSAWLFAGLNFTTNVPFGADSVIALIDNYIAAQRHWSEANRRQRTILVITSIIVPLLVVCGLIGASAPLVDLVFSKLGSGWSSYVLSVLTILATQVVEFLYQGMQGIVMDPEDPRVLSGYIRNPLYIHGEKGSHKLRNAFAIFCAFCSAVPYPAFTYLALHGHAALWLVILVTIFALIPAAWSNGGSANTAVAIPLANLLSPCCTRLADLCRNLYTAISECDPWALCPGLRYQAAGYGQFENSDDEDSDTEQV